MAALEYEVVRLRSRVEVHRHVWDVPQLYNAMHVDDNNRHGKDYRKPKYGFGDVDELARHVTAAALHYNNQYVPESFRARHRGLVSTDGLQNNPVARQTFQRGKLRSPADPLGLIGRYVTARVSGGGGGAPSGFGGGAPEYAVRLVVGFDTPTATYTLRDLDADPSRAYESVAQAHVARYPRRASYMYVDGQQVPRVRGGCCCGPMAHPRSLLQPAPRHNNNRSSSARHPGRFRPRGRIRGGTPLAMSSRAPRWWATLATRASFTKWCHVATAWCHVATA